MALIWHSTTCSGSNLCNSCICFKRLIETLCFRAALIWSWVEQVMWKRVSKEMWINPKLAIGPSGAVDSLEFVKRHQIWTVKKNYKFLGSAVHHEWQLSASILRSNGARGGGRRDRRVRRVQGAGHPQHLWHVLDQRLHCQCWAGGKTGPPLSKTQFNLETTMLYFASCVINVEKYKYLTAGLPFRHLI